MSGSYLLTDLPSEILENVLSYLSYDEISKNRVVCRKFDTTCKVLLNHGFFDLERRHAYILKKFKSLLPRRESERRTHPLARHLAILIAMETRISMLRTTFASYIEKNACCFIPGKVLDEIIRIIKIVCITDTLPRAHEFLQELRDISSMAMEHFDEKIAPNLKINPFAPPAPIISGRRLLKLQDFFVNNSFHKSLKLLQQQNQMQKKQITYLKDVVSKLCNKLKNQHIIMNHQTRKIREQSTKIKQQDNSITELKRHVEQWDTKFQDLVQSLKNNEDSSINTNTNTSVVKTSIDTVGASPIIYKSNIKPRKAQIRNTPVYDIEHRKRKLGVDTDSNVPVPKLSRLQFLSDAASEDVVEELNHDDTHTYRSTNQPENYRYSDSALLKLPSFLTSGIETLLKSPISSIQSRKRKLQTFEQIN